MKKSFKLLVPSALVVLTFSAAQAIYGAEEEQKDPLAMKSVKQEIEELEKRLAVLRVQAAAQVAPPGGPSLFAPLQAEAENQQRESVQIRQDPLKHQRIEGPRRQVRGDGIWNTIKKKKMMLAISGGVLFGSILGGIWNGNNIPIISDQNQIQPDLPCGSRSILEHKSESLEEIDHCNGITKWLFPLICQKLEKLGREAAERRQEEKEEIREKQEIFLRGSKIFSQYRLLLNATVEDLNQGDILEDVRKLYVASEDNPAFKCRWPMIKSVRFIVRTTNNMQNILPELCKRRKNEANDLEEDCHKRNGPSYYTLQNCLAEVSDLQVRRLREITHDWCSLAQAYNDKVKEDLSEFIKLYRIMELSRHEIWEEFTKIQKASITNCKPQIVGYRGDGEPIMQYTIN
jgi:hypothetical protein